MVPETETGDYVLRCTQQRGWAMAHNELPDQDHGFGELNVQPCPRQRTENKQQFSNRYAPGSEAWNLMCFREIDASDLQTDPTVRSCGAITDDSFNGPFISDHVRPLLMIERRIA